MKVRAVISWARGEGKGQEEGLETVVLLCTLMAVMVM